MSDQNVLKLIADLEPIVGQLEAILADGKVSWLEDIQVLQLIPQFVGAFSDAKGALVDVKAGMSAQEYSEVAAKLLDAAGRLFKLLK